MVISYAESLLDDRSTSGNTSRRRRIALYSHDTMGLGHTRRNMLLANALAQAVAPADILLISGASETNSFAMPPDVDVLTLPALRKDGDGHYHARRVSVPLHEIIALRSRVIESALMAFAPDVLIVDNVPRGACRELDHALATLRSIGHANIILGLRDVLDDPAVIAHEWARAENFQAIRTFFDAVWVYGDPRVYDTVRAYDFPLDIAARTTYTGYLDGRLRPAFSYAASEAAIRNLALESRRFVLCMVGGGGDGASVARAVVHAQVPDDRDLVIVTGPYMPEVVQHEVRRAASANPRVRVVDFLPEPTLLLPHAERVITMGGYNTVGEVLAFERPCLIVPRVAPRREQLIRAERLRDLGLVDVLHPDTVSPEAISAWLASDHLCATRARSRLNIGGLSRIPVLLDGLFDRRTTRTPSLAVQTEGTCIHVA